MAESDLFTYELLPSLPANKGYSIQPGLAGAYSCMDDNALIVAGSANFPDAQTWEGGQKIYYNEIFVLQNKNEEWQILKQ